MHEAIGQMPLKASASNIDELSGPDIPSKMKREMLRLNVEGDGH